MALFLVTISALIFAGTGAGAYALYLALLAITAPARAAAIVAGAFLAASLGFVLVIGLRPRASVLPEAEPRRLSRGGTDQAALFLLADLAREKPLLAILAAGLMGAVVAILKRKA